jgi:hypothetical protein
MATMNKNEGFLTFVDVNGKFNSINLDNVAEVKFDCIDLGTFPIDSGMVMYENLLIAFLDKKQNVFKMLCFGFPCENDTTEIGFDEAYSIQKMFGVKILQGYDND